MKTKNTQFWAPSVTFSGATLTPKHIWTRKHWHNPQRGNEPWLLLWSSIWVVLFSVCPVYTDGGKKTLEETGYVVTLPSLTFHCRLLWCDILTVELDVLFFALWHPCTCPLSTFAIFSDHHSDHQHHAITFWSFKYMIGSYNICLPQNRTILPGLMSNRHDKKLMVASL